MAHVRQTSRREEAGITRLFDDAQLLLRGVPQRVGLAMDAPDGPMTHRVTASFPRRHSDAFLAVVWCAS